MPSSRDSGAPRGPEEPCDPAGQGAEHKNKARGCHRGDDPDQDREIERSATAWPDSSTVAVSAPGPAISGMASGNAAMLRTCSSIACSAVPALDPHAKNHFRHEAHQATGNPERGQ